MEPYVLFKHFEESSLKIALYGAPADWSTSRFQEVGDHENDLGLYNRLNTIARRYGIYRIFAPSPMNFNALVCGRDGFKVSIQKEVGDVCIMRGAYVDGVVLPPVNGEACAMPTADCPTIVAHCAGTKQTVVAHAGCGSIIHIGKVLRGEEPRTNPSVVDAIMGLFTGRSSQVKVFITCGISGSSYCYPELVPFVSKTFGEDCVLGKTSLDLKKIITRQFLKRGVSYIISDTINTFADKDSKNKFLWHSYRRDKTRFRNLILVFNG